MHNGLPYCLIQEREKTWSIIPLGPVRLFTRKLAGLFADRGCVCAVGYPGSRGVLFYGEGTWALAQVWGAGGSPTISGRLGRTYS